MKRAAWRLAACLVLLCLVSSAWGEGIRGYDKTEGYVYLTLGQYPQTAEGEVQPILWRVLAVEGQQAYLCSEYILFCRPMHPNREEYKKNLGGFAVTELCQYLNTTFADEAFTPEELTLLDTFEPYGKIFLLSSEDLKNTAMGMGEATNIKKNPGLRAWGTPYAIENGLFVYGKSAGSHSCYWTRDPSTNKSYPWHFRCTKVDGRLGRIDCERENEGVRPAVYLNLEAAEIISGTGTMEDPFTLAAEENVPDQ